MRRERGRLSGKEAPEKLKQHEEGKNEAKKGKKRKGGKKAE